MIRERKAERHEEVDRKDADKFGQTEPQDRGVTREALSKKDAEGKANGWLGKAEITPNLPDGVRSEKL